MTLDDIPLHVVLFETADAYEILAALPPTISDTGGRKPGKPGSKVPPGAAILLDIEEYQTTIAELDDWAEFVAHVLIDEEPGIGKVSDSTPGRLRLAARWSDKLQGLDYMLVYALRYDAVEHLKAVRRLVRRSNRIVRTGSECLNVACKGKYEAIVDGPEIDGDLVCSACKDRVPHEQWSRWGARSEWVTVAHAANMLGTSTNAVMARASRGSWRRRNKGREVEYLAEDVRAQLAG